METQVEIEEEEAGGLVEDKIYVAVGKDVNKSKPTLLWALNNSGGRKICLLHVHQPAPTIPFMGGKFRAEMLEEQELRAYRDRENKKMHTMFNEYLFICAQAGVRAEKEYIEMQNIEKGIVELVAQHGIKRLIMGAVAGKHKRMTTLKSKKAIFVSQQAHISCHIWFVCKGGLIQKREGSLDGTITLSNCLQAMEIQGNQSTDSPSSSSSDRTLSSSSGSLDGMVIGTSESPLASPITETSQAVHLRSRSEGQRDHVITNPVRNYIPRVRSYGRNVVTVSPLDGTTGTSMPQHPLGAEENVNVTEWEKITRTTSSRGSGFLTWSSCEEEGGSSEYFSLMREEGSEDGSLLPSIQESEEDFRRASPMNELQDEGRIDREMFDQLQQAMEEVENSKKEAFEEFVKRRKAEKDAIEAMRKAKESESLYANEVKGRKEMELVLQKYTLELNNIKRHRDEVTEELRTALDHRIALESQVADSGRMMQELEEKIVMAVELLVPFKQVRDRLQLERDNAVKEAEELRKRREEEATSSQREHFSTEFALPEINAATLNFDPHLIIGEGGYGSVYKGILRNTEVAIKLLRSSSLQGRSEFQREVDVLSRMRHPNLLTLIGTCPEAWALIYEYLPNGSLEDRLACKDNTLPLSWQIRIRIAVEICSALIFLHYNKPHGIVHGDLKPANILLDANFVSKLGDFGICRSLPDDEISNNTTTLCCRTNYPKGTLAYMDPVFLSTGELTPKSDVYSFGIVLLQLLTGRPALGIAKEVQYAVDKGTLSDLLDSSAGNWPFVQAKQLAYLALGCCEMNRKNRPDLISEVRKVLEPMKAACGASSSFKMGSGELSRAPFYFLCPIFQEVMHDPWVAADGYTYEAEGIRSWLDDGRDTSPVTNVKLAHKDLVPNHSLRSAIQEWRQQD